MDIAGAQQSCGLNAVEFLFAERNSRFLIEIDADKQSEWEALMSNVACVRLGNVTGGDQVVVRSGEQVWVDKPWSELFDAWHQPLDW